MGKLSSYIERSNQPLSSFIVEDSKPRTQEAITPGKGKRSESIVEDYVNGMSTAELSDKYSISMGQLFSHLRAKKIPSRFSKPPKDSIVEKLKHLDTTDIYSIIVDYEEGMPNKQIYKKYNLHKNGLYNILDMNGVKRKRLSKKKEEVKKE